MNSFSQDFSALPNGPTEQVTRYQRALGLLFMLLVASLPFFSVRNPLLVVSPPLILLLLMSVVVVIRSAITIRMPISISLLDICIFAYIALIVVNLAIVPNADGARLAFAKTLVYVLTYVCLKMMLRDLSIWQIASNARNGALLGTLVFACTVVICVMYTGRVGELLTKFSFQSVTGTIFRSIDQVLGSGAPDDFESKDIMRNAVAESFALFFLITLVFRFANPSSNFLMQVANILLVIITFSRRAFYGIAMVVAGSSIKDARGLKRGIYLATIVSAVVAATFLLQENVSESRILDISDKSRPEMFADGLQLFAQNPLFGTGFGSKLERGSYIHNFVIGSAAMLGMFGLLLALTIYTSVIVQFLQRLAYPKAMNASVFLVIPILSMSVGATFEGLFTVTGWIGIALFNVCEEKQTAMEFHDQSSPPQANRFHYPGDVDVQYSAAYRGLFGSANN